MTLTPEQNDAAILIMGIVTAFIILIILILILFIMLYADDTKS